MFVVFIFFASMSVNCASGVCHTIILSDNGLVYSFGKNLGGKLGLGHNNDVSLPIQIPNLPIIKQIACGGNYSICLDENAFIWSFGKNDRGQLGTGNIILNYKVPQKIRNIPPVSYVDCGFEHTLIITNDANLWSCGKNTTVDNYVLEIQKINQHFNKQHSLMFQ